LRTVDAQAGLAAGLAGDSKNFHLLERTLLGGNNQHAFLLAVIDITLTEIKLPKFCFNFRLFGRRSILDSDRQVTFTAIVRTSASNQLLSNDSNGFQLHDYI
jgi:hypothetical protein